MAKVYIKTDENNYVVSIGSNVFLTNLTDFFKIDEGVGDKYAHAQGQYLEKGLTDSQGRYNYKWVDETLVEVAESDKPTIEVKETATTQDKIEAQVMYTALMTDTLLEEE